MGVDRRSAGARQSCRRDQAGRTPNPAANATDMDFVMLRDKTAIAGVGYTPFSRNSGVSTLTLAAQAIKNAAEDAGLSVKDIDGLATHAGNDSVPVSVLAGALGLPELNFYL